METAPDKHNDSGCGNRQWDNVQTRLSEEVTNIEAEVAARSEVLRRYTAEAAAKAALEQVELRDAVSRTHYAAEARYHADLHRERETHRRARNAMSPNANRNVI